MRLGWPRLFGVSDHDGASKQQQALNEICCLARTVLQDTIGERHALWTAFQIGETWTNVNIVLSAWKTLELLRSDFQERYAEVDAYMRLVAAVEHAAQNGAPILRGRTGEPCVVEPLQQKILYGGVYLYLYNLVEATVARSILAVEEAASGANLWRAGDLSTKLRAEWVRSMARPSVDLNPENRFSAALELCEHLIGMLPVQVKIEKGGGGNWDDKAIDRLASRIGVQLELAPEMATAVKRHFREEKGPLEFIKHFRNKLAHGNMSFAECGDGMSSTELQNQLVMLTKNYLEAVIGSFETFIKQHEFLIPEKRPAPGGQ